VLQGVAKIGGILQKWIIQAQNPEQIQDRGGNYGKRF
jgi:hypothetical protein